MEGSRYRSQFRYHERFGYWFRPNLRIRIPGSDRAGVPSYTIETNSVGARCRHEPLSRGGGRTRVLFIGCSMTAGDKVGNAYRFTDLLDRHLGGLECHNYALSGSGNDQQYLVHEHFQSAVAPDVFVLSPSAACPWRNLLGVKATYDPLTNGLVQRPKPYFELEDGALVLRNVPVPRRHREPEAWPAGEADRTGGRSLFRRALGALRSLARLGAGSQRSAYAIPDHPGDALTRQILLATLRTSTAAKKILMPVPTVPAAARSETDRYRDFLGAIAAEGGAEYLDLIEPFASLPKAKRGHLFFPYEGHLTEYGHEEIARLLAPVLGRLAAAIRA
jgi:hypothetical protein